MSIFVASVFDTVWDLGFTDIVATDRLISQVEQDLSASDSKSLEPFASVCSQQQLAVVLEALRALETPDSNSLQSLSTPLRDSTVSSSVPLWSKLRYIPLNMFSDIPSVLAKSNQPLTIRCCMEGLGFERPKLLNKMTSLRGLRGVYLHDCTIDWSVLAEIPSLRNITLQYSQYGLINSSPFLRDQNGLQDISPLQEWDRSGAEKKWRLRKFEKEHNRNNRAFDMLPSETHLGFLGVSFHEALVPVLPRCRSLHSLKVVLSSTEQVAPLSEALLHAPFISSLSLLLPDERIDFTSLPLSGLTSFCVWNGTIDSVSEALTKSKPKSLTHLELTDVVGDVEPLAGGLLTCPALTSLSFLENERSKRDVLPVVQTLPSLRPLRKLLLDMYEYSDESISSLVSFLTRSAVQDLKLGTLSPKQVQLVADALPSLPSLQSFEFDTWEFSYSHEPSYLALFSALTLSSIRSFTLSHGFKSHLTPA
jgi:hypothetical protein